MVNQRKRYLQLSSFLVAFFLLWTLRLTVFGAVDESIASLAWRAAYSNLLKFAMWVLPAAAFVYVLRGEPPARYMGLSVWPSRRNWLLCISVTLAYLLAVTLYEMTIGEKCFSTAYFSSVPTGFWLLQLLLPPLLEELFFRGFLMTELLALMPLCRALALTSLLFACIHVPYWLTHGASTQAIVTNGVEAFVFSILAGWLFAKTASIWPSTFAHTAVNLLASMLAAGNVWHVP
jgi:membrane protease YdiL (CAAX protease family)